MASVVIGRLLCEKCGADCTNLWGSKLEVRGPVAANSAGIQKELTLVDQTFGKHNFYLCWTCAAKLMGAKTLAEQKAEQVVEAKVVEQEQPKQKKSEK